MSDSGVFDIFSWDGRAGRARYLGTGLVLLALKHNLDRALAAMFGYPWSPISYLVFVSPDGGIKAMKPDDAMFYVVLLVFAMPFIFVGTAMTLQRLRDAGLPLWLVMLFYVPFLNLIFFAILSVLPSRQPAVEEAKAASRIGRLIPHGEFGSAFLGIVVTALLSVTEIVFSTNGLGQYGWGLFVGIPFFLGLNSTMIYGFHQPRSLGKCLVVALLSIALVGLALLAFALEGLICLVMALPLAVPIAIIVFDKYVAGGVRRFHAAARSVST
jgi:uncharacterized membrane protein YhaH (DUF805 family)